MDSRLLPAYTRQETPSVEHSEVEGVNIVPTESAEELEIPHATEFKAVQPQTTPEPADVRPMSPMQKVPEPPAPVPDTPHHSPSPPPPSNPPAPAPSTAKELKPVNIH